MDYLTQYYKNRAEKLQEELDQLTSLNENIFDDAYQLVQGLWNQTFGTSSGARNNVAPGSHTRPGARPPTRVPYSKPGSGQPMPPPGLDPGHNSPRFPGPDRQGWPSDQYGNPYSEYPRTDPLTGSEYYPLQ
jgi:hypothetical protein